MKAKTFVPPAPVISAWDKLRDPKCKDCDLHKTAQSVCLIGRGPVPSKIMVIGEAPGHREDDIGKPFAGKSGELLDELLAEAKLTREEVFISNACKCRPPENRTPRPKEITACKHYLEAEIALVRPKYIISLGATAMKAVLGKAGITEHRGDIIVKDEITYFLTFHPAMIFRQPYQLSVVKADFSKFGRAIRGEAEKRAELNWTLVDTPAKFMACIKALREAEVIAYDIETNTLNPFQPDAKIYCIGLAHDDKQWIVPVSYPNNPFEEDSLRERTMKLLEEVLLGKTLVAHNGKYDSKMLRKLYGWKIHETFDTMLASHLLDENSLHGLKPLSRMHFGAHDYTLDQPVDPEEISLKELGKYCAYDVYYTLRFYHLFQERLADDPQLRKIFSKLIMPASRILERIELTGVYVDRDKYRKALQTNTQNFQRSIQDLNQNVGYPINWNSHPQVRKLLFGEPREDPKTGDITYHDGLGLEPLDMTDGGVPSTAEPVLKQLRDQHKIINQILYQREQKKLGEFLVGWGEKFVGNWLHPSFKLHGTVTGRLSCEDPNIQQVPRDTFLRSLITAPPGWVLVEADYSQIELRVAAMLSGDRAMKRAFQTGQDIHSQTAAAVMGISIDQVDKDQRKKAKAVNFGFVYAMGSRGFQVYARDKYEIFLSLKESEAFRERFFDLYNELPNWHERQRRLVHKYKYVRNPIGRKRRLPEIDSPDKYLRSEAERQAINSPVQSFASDIALFSLVRIRRAFSWSKVRIVGIVHDAILFMVKKEYIDEILPQVHEIMTNMEIMEKAFDIRISIPIEIEMKVGPWGIGKVVEFS